MQPIPLQTRTVYGQALSELMTKTMVASSALKRARGANSLRYLQELYIMRKMRIGCLTSGIAQKKRLACIPISSLYRSCEYLTQAAYSSHSPNKADIHNHIHRIFLPKETYTVRYSQQSEDCPHKRAAGSGRG